MAQQTTTVHGYIRTTAETSSNHPLQTQLSLILTDFEPNGNKQGVPVSEKDNILRSALNQPIKINFVGDGFTGHEGAIPIGPIVRVYEDEDNGRPVIKADAIIWNEVYGDVSQYIKQVFDDGIGTSWEIYFDQAERDSNGVDWLKNTLFAGSCIVDVPAYGPNRTRILAVAESLNKQAESIMADNDTVDTEETKQIAESESSDMQETRTDLTEVQDLLFKLWEGVDTLYNQTFQIEQQQITNDIGSIASSFAEKLTKIADKLGELRTANAELIEEKDLQIKNAKRVERQAAIAELGIVVSDQRLERYVAMSDEDFTVYLEDMRDISAKKVQKTEAALNDVIPEPINSGELSISELAAQLKKEFSK